MVLNPFLLFRVVFDQGSVSVSRRVSIAPSFLVLVCFPQETVGALTWGLVAPGLNLQQLRCLEVLSVHKGVRG